MSQTDHSTASVQAGRLRHRVTLQKPELVRDDFGQPVAQWIDVKTIWAEVGSVSGREFISASAEQAETTIRIWMRYRPDINSTWRIVHHPPTGNGEIYAIDAVLPRRKTLLEVMCSSGVKND